MKRTRATAPGVVLLAGPTASGKSALALEWAERLGGMVVNADSMQVYSTLRILTARPDGADEARVPHRLYGHVDPRTAYSVGSWLQDVRSVLQETSVPLPLPLPRAPSRRRIATSPSSRRSVSASNRPALCRAPCRAPRRAAGGRLTLGVGDPQFPQVADGPEAVPRKSVSTAAYETGGFGTGGRPNCSS